MDQWWFTVKDKKYRALNTDGKSKFDSYIYIERDSLVQINSMYM